MRIPDLYFQTECFHFVAIYSVLLIRVKFGSHTRINPVVNGAKFYLLNLKTVEVVERKSVFQFVFLGPPYVLSNKVFFHWLK